MFHHYNTKIMINFRILSTFLHYRCCLKPLTVMLILWSWPCTVSSPDRSRRKNIYNGIAIENLKLLFKNLVPLIILINLWLISHMCNDLNHHIVNHYIYVTAMLMLWFVAQKLNNGITLERKRNCATNHKYCWISILR